MDAFATVFLPAALAVIMFSLGLGLTVADFTRVALRPKAFAVGALSQMVVIPVAAYGVAALFRLPPDLSLGLMILAICPGGITSNILAKYARSDVALSISLTGVISLAAVFTVPFLVAILADHYLGIEARDIDVAMLGISMFNICAIPVMLGMMVRHYSPGLSAALDAPLAKLVLLLFVLIVGGTVAANWTPFVEAIAVLGPALLLLTVVLLAIGLALARLFALDRGEATAISIETGIQNTAFGVTVGTLIAEQASGMPPFSLPSAIYGMVMYLVGIPFVLWRRTGDSEVRPERDLDVGQTSKSRR